MIRPPIVGVSFAVLAINFPADGETPASTSVSFVRDIAPMGMGAVGFVILAYLFIAGFSNAVNLTDGLDGLASGCAAMVFAAYVFISFWQFTHDCANELVDGCYQARDPLDVTLVAAAALGACHSPEARRARGGGPGADVGNRGPSVELHGRTNPFFQTPPFGQAITR